MRVAASELDAVRRGGLLIRYARLGPVAFVLAEVTHGTAGTLLEVACEQEHWGLVLAGDVRLVSGRSRRLRAGTAFHVPPGPPEHRLTGEGRILIGGFAPASDDLDDSPEALRALGLEVVRPRPAVPASGDVVRVAGTSRLRAVDGIEARSARMGAWGFTRIAFGPLTGYTSGWCDLPHWGLVLRGDVVLRSETDSELLTQGDVFYRPPGPPGHQFEVADAATIIDYTPLEALRSADRREAWRPRVRGHGPVDTSL